MKVRAIWKTIRHLSLSPSGMRHWSPVWGARAPRVTIAAPRRNVSKKRKFATARAPSVRAGLAIAREAWALPRSHRALRPLVPIVFCLFAALAAAEATPSDDMFAKANTEFAAGNFKVAIKDYSAVVQSGAWSANLFYDLGNAYFRDSDFGRAILNYERALQLDRNHPEADANLRIARDQTHALELAQSPLQKYLNFASVNSFTILAAILFWGTIILLILRRRKFLWTTVGLLLTAGCGLTAYKLENGTRGQAIAVVVGDNVEARVATADSAKSVLALPPGSEVVILQERGDWSYAALPNDQRGWISTKAVEKVRL